MKSLFYKCPQKKHQWRLMEQRVIFSTRLSLTVSTVGSGQRLTLTAFFFYSFFSFLLRVSRGESEKGKYRQSQAKPRQGVIIDSSRRTELLTSSVLHLSTCFTSSRSLTRSGFLQTPTLIIQNLPTNIKPWINTAFLLLHCCVILLFVFICSLPNGFSSLVSIRFRQRLLCKLERLPLLCIDLGIICFRRCCLSSFFSPLAVQFTGATHTSVIWRLPLLFLLHILHLCLCMSSAFRKLFFPPSFNGLFAKLKWILWKHQFSKPFFQTLPDPRWSLSVTSWPPMTRPSFPSPARENQNLLLWDTRGIWPGVTVHNNSRWKVKIYIV